MQGSHTAAHLEVRAVGSRKVANESSCVAQVQALRRMHSHRSGQFMPSRPQSQM